MRTGKLPVALLGRLLATVAPTDPRVRVGASPGEDAAVIDIPAGSLVVTTDPVTFPTTAPAWYAVQVNANDIAAMGADPNWLAVTLLLPPSSVESEVDGLFQQLRTACAGLGISVVTGHTEITDAVVRPLVVGTMLGLVPNGHAVTSAGARPDDALILAGAVGLEGTAILAGAARKQLLAGGMDEAELTAAEGLLTNPGISVVAASRILRRTTNPHALHDATEGGVATAIREVAEASGLGVEVSAASVPLLNITLDFCRELRLSPFGLLSSGCLVAAVDPGDVGRVLAGLAEAGIRAAHAGSFTREPGCRLVRAGIVEELPSFDRDELARFLEQLECG